MMSSIVRWKIWIMKKNLKSLLKKMPRRNTPITMPRKWKGTLKKCTRLVNKSKRRSNRRSEMLNKEGKIEENSVPKTKNKN